jgi:hypothetical protein
MKLKRHNDISENEIEEALVANLLYLKELLGLSKEVKLIARQQRLRDGEQRADLLLANGKELCLVELKVTKFTHEFLKQTTDYKKELLNLQEQGLLVGGIIKPYLMITEARRTDKELCNSEGVELIIYEPLDVLKQYYENLSAVAPFLRIKPNDYGVFNIGLINRAVLELGRGLTKQNEIASKIKLSKGSVHNHLRVAKEFGLVRERNKSYFLTDLGDKYVQVSNQGILIDTLSKGQIEILKEFIAKDPFYSSTVFGIYSVVESAFILSRNKYPIELEDLRKMFQTVSGKISEWKALKSLSTATYTFLNFAIDLELLGKIGKQIVITPAGFRFILMLQLHKSIEMIDSLTSNIHS